jgi:ABC-type branched-subunit amino acid transport system substrate-binding protein
MRLGIHALLALAMGWLCISARAEILIGQTADLSGPAAVSMKECNDGARLWIDAVNAQGGIRGQQIRLVSLDDAFQPQKTAENARKLIDQGVISLFLTRGTPNTLAVLPLLSEFHVPLVAPSTGAIALSEPTHPWVFNVRSSYQHEAERAVNHLTQIGIQRLAIVQTADSFGEDAVLGVLKGLSAAKLAPVAHVKFDRLKPNFEALMPEVIKAGPEAVFFLGSSTSVAKGIQQLRAAGSHAQALTLSNNASTGFIRELGDSARGVIVSQVFPYERSRGSAFVRAAQDLARQQSIGEPTPQFLEGFAAAKVLVEALRQTGPNPTRATLTQALNNMHAFDLGGGLVINYDPNHHAGLHFVDLSIIDASGRFRR